MNLTITETSEYIDLVAKANRYTKLYDLGKPEISDKEWDDIYFAIADFEQRTGIVLSSSPTQDISFTVVNELKKVTHDHYLLSLAKTKDPAEVADFIGDNEAIAMLKLDGLTCTLTYEGGNLVAAATRGNGVVGEDIYHNAVVIPNIPKKINCTNRVVVDGEIICDKESFKEFANEYKNPRNFAAGSIRLLNSKECASRILSFIAWDVITGVEAETLSDKLIAAANMGFSIVPFVTLTKDEVNMNESILEMRDGNSELPCDGLVFKYNNCKVYDAAGRTDHHFKGGLAYKFYDEEYETNLLDIEWSMGRKGVLTPVAIFEPIIIDGTEVSRASLHNVSVMYETMNGGAFVGEKISVIKSNQIIPQIAKAETGIPKNRDVQLIPIPSICPICGGPLETSVSEAGVKNLVCNNVNCEGKLINILDHYCGKKGMDIKGLSKATLEKLIDWGWVSNITEIYSLDNFRDEWINKAGFGVKSVDNILDAIEKSRDCSLEQFISALGIPLIGRRVAQEICKHISTYDELRQKIDSHYDFTQWDTFGYEKFHSLISFDFSNADIIYKNYIKIQQKENNDNEQTLTGLTFVITGKVKKFKNRDEIKALIENAGGKVASSVTSKTDYLINNDISSNTSKNVTAQRLGKPIITEEEFINLFGISV